MPDSTRSNDRDSAAHRASEEAFERLRPRMVEIATADRKRVNLDIPSATTLVLGHLRPIRELRPEIVAQLPLYDVERFDSLESCALALTHAHARYLVAVAPPAVPPELNASAIALRSLLAAEVHVLARRGLVDASRLGAIKGPIGYKNVAFDLMGIAALLREHWSSIAGKTAIAPADIVRAGKLGDELIAAVVARAERPEQLAETILDRERAFTLLVDTYDHVRSAVVFLRWRHGDADRIAPSLYRRRRRRKRARGSAGS